MATLDPVKNFAKSLLDNTGGINASATSLDVTAGDGAKFPATADGDYNIVIWDKATYPDPADDPDVEIVRVTERSTDTLTITRGQEGTTATSHANGAGILLDVTKKMIDDIRTALSGGGSVQELIRDFVVNSTEAVSVGDIVSFVNDKVIKGKGAMLGTRSDFLSSANNYIHSISVGTDKIIVGWFDSANSGTYYIKFVVGTLTNGEITFGTVYSIAGGYYEDWGIAKVDTDKFVLAWRDQPNSNNYARIGTVSGSSISWGSDALFLGGTYAGDVSVDADTSKCVVVYYDGSASAKATASVGSISGTTISFGTKHALSTGTGYNPMVALLSATSFVVTFRDTTYTGKVVAGTISGTSITSSGTPITYRADQTSSKFQRIKKLDSTHFVAHAQNNSYSSKYLRVGSVSGNSITLGTELSLSTADETVIYYSDISVVSSSEILLACEVSDMGELANAGDAMGVKIVSFSISGTTISKLKDYGYLKSGLRISYLNLLANGSNYIIVGKFRGYGGRAIEMKIKSTAGKNYIGIAKTAGATGDTISVGLGGVVSGLSGLTSGEDYYDDGSGGLTTDSGLIKIGTAISSTELLLSNNL